MNIREINPGTLGKASVYVSILLSLTLLTTWIIIAFQSSFIFEEDVPFIKRLGWPIEILSKMMKKNKKQDEGAEYTWNSETDISDNGKSLDIEQLDIVSG